MSIKGIVGRLARLEEARGYRPPRLDFRKVPAALWAWLATFEHVQRASEVRPGVRSRRPITDAEFEAVQKHLREERAA